MPMKMLHNSLRTAITIVIAVISYMSSVQLSYAQDMTPMTRQDSLYAMVERHMPPLYKWAQEELEEYKKANPSLLEYAAICTNYAIDYTNTSSFTFDGDEPRPYIGEFGRDAAVMAVINEGLWLTCLNDSLLYTPFAAYLTAERARLKLADGLNKEAFYFAQLTTSICKETGALTPYLTALRVKAEATKDSVPDYCEDALNRLIEFDSEHPDEKYSDLVGDNIRLAEVALARGDLSRAWKIFEHADSLLYAKGESYSVILPTGHPKVIMLDQLLSKLYLASDSLQRFFDLQWRIANDASFEDRLDITTKAAYNALQDTATLNSEVGVDMGYYNSRNLLKELPRILPAMTPNMRNRHIGLVQKVLPYYNLSMVNFLKNHPYSDDAWYETPSDSALSASIYNNLLLFKGLQLRGDAAMKKFIKEETMAKVGTVFVKLISKDLGDDISGYTWKDQVWGNINRQAMLDSETQQKLWLKWTDIASKLYRREVAIEFFKVPVPGSEDSKYYAAVLKYNSQFPKIVELFNESEIKTIDPELWYLSGKLQNIIWGALQSEIEGANTVYFSPDGLLHAIAIETLAPNGDTCDYVRVTSTANLMDEVEPLYLNNGIALLGGMDYDGIPGDKRPANVEFAVNRGDDQTRDGFLPLKASGEEVKEIAEIFKDSGVPIRLYTGSDATESQFKELFRDSVNIIHVSTHGFLYNPKTFENKFGGRQLITSDTRNYFDEFVNDALARCGLLFTGANRWLLDKDNDSSEDGFLTAQEISFMDLSDTKLAVLSACETGLGDLQYDGVYGLQRAFKMAGVESLLVSLWKVNDYATKLLMTKFYENIAEGKTVRVSLKNAQNAVKNFKGVIDGQPYQFEDPKYWAGFVLIDVMP